MTWESSHLVFAVGKSTYLILHREECSWLGAEIKDLGAIFDGKRRKLTSKPLVSRALPSLSFFLLYFLPSTVCIFLALRTKTSPKPTGKMSSLARATATESDPDRGPQLRAFVIFWTIIILTSICLRFWSRALGVPSRQQPRFMWDDWTALASAVCPVPILVSTRLHCISD